MDPILTYAVAKGLGALMGAGREAAEAEADAKQKQEELQRKQTAQQYFRFPDNTLKKFVAGMDVTNAKLEYVLLNDQLQDVRKNRTEALVQTDTGQIGTPKDFRPKTDATVKSPFLKGMAGDVIALSGPSQKMPNYKIIGHRTFNRDGSFKDETYPGFDVNPTLPNEFVFTGTVDGKTVQGTLPELQAKNATDIAQQEITQAGKPAGMADFSKVPQPEKDDPKFGLFITVARVKQDGSQEDKQETIEYSEYLNSPSKFVPTEGLYFQTEDGTKEGKIIKTVQLPKLGELSGALAESNAVFSMKHKTVGGKDNHFMIDSDVKEASQQLRLFRRWLRQDIPEDGNGDPDWNTASMSAEDIENTMLYAADLIEAQARIADPEDPSRTIIDRNLLVDTPEELNRRYGDLARIPNLADEIQMRYGDKTRKAHNFLAALNARSPNGDTQITLVGNANIDVPAQQLNPNADPAEPPRPVVLSYPISFSAEYSEEVKLVLSFADPNAEITINENGLMEVTGSSPQKIQQAKDVVNTLLVYEEQINAQTGAREQVRGANGLPVLAQEQPKMKFVSFLRRNTDIDGVPYAVTWRNMVGRGSTGAENQQIVDAIKDQFTATVGDDIQAGVQIIKAFSPADLGPKSDEILYTRMVEDSARDFKSERSGRLQQSESASIALDNIRSMKQTFYTQNGEFIDLNTALGQLYVNVDGAIYAFNQFIAPKIPGLSNMLNLGRDDVASGAILKNHIFGADNTGEMYYNRVVLTASDEELEILAKDQGISVEEFKNREEAAYNENVALFEEEVGSANITSSNEVVRNLALRNYYRFMVAYSLAAAIQGGTGGRTISDQDVQNILKALKLNNILGKASTEIAVLDAAEEMILKIQKSSDLVAKGDAKTRYAALKYQELTMGGYRRSNMTSKSMATRINAIVPVNTGAAQNNIVGAAGGDPADTRTDDEKLDAINAYQAFGGVKYDSLPEAITALGQTAVTRILNKTK